jgi:regulator of sigma E protease
MLLLSATDALLAANTWPSWLYNTLMFIKVLIGFSIIIFVHELGHFLAAKWVGIRVDRFSVGFGTRLFGYRRGEGLTFGNRPDYSANELEQRDYGETDYCFKVLPIGGYVKMLGQDDVVINEESGEVRLSDDPRAFTSRPVGQRMIVVSAGVIFNLLFAAVLLMSVFLVGKQMLSPVIGTVHPDSPAQGSCFQAIVC